MVTRRLIVMRHASAGAGRGPDSLRRLTERGLDEARRMGERLRSLAWVPDRALCATASRCRETWELAS